MINIKSCQRGQGLIEAIAAIAIITISLSAIISLIVIGLSASRENRCRVIATNLAREAIEAARNKRDSNWLDIEAGTAGAEWDNDLYGANEDYSGIIEFNHTEGDNDYNDWIFQFQPNNINDSRCGLYLKDGIYKQSKNNIAAGTLTKYHRLIRLNPICELADGSESIINDGAKCGDLGGVKIGIQAIAQVDWIESGRNHNLLLEDRLYNWK